MTYIAVYEIHNSQAVDFGDIMTDEESCEGPPYALSWR